MRRGLLADLFVGVAVKRLSAVDADPKRSNQHEVGTTREMRDAFLGEEQHRRFDAIYIWLGEDQDAFTIEGIVTHYDARAQNPRRSAEWQLYYHSNPVTEAMCQGDTLFLARDENDILYFIVAPYASTSERQLSWLFNLRPAGPEFVAREISRMSLNLISPLASFWTRSALSMKSRKWTGLIALLTSTGMSFQEPWNSRIWRALRFKERMPATNRTRHSWLGSITKRRFFDGWNAESYRPASRQGSSTVKILTSMGS